MKSCWQTSCSKSQWKVTELPQAFSFLWIGWWDWIETEIEFCSRIETLSLRSPHLVGVESQVRLKAWPSIYLEAIAPCAPWKATSPRRNTSAENSRLLVCGAELNVEGAAAVRRYWQLSSSNHTPPVVQDIIDIVSWIIQYIGAENRLFCNQALSVCAWID